MADEQYDRAMLLRMYEKKKKELEENLIPPPAASSGAFPDTPPETATSKLAAPFEEEFKDTREKGWPQTIAEVGIPTAASMLASGKAARYIAPIAKGLATKGGGVPAGILRTVTPMLAAGGATLVSQLSMELAKTVGDLPGKPDSISDALYESGNAALWDAGGEGIGQVVGKVTSKLMPYRKVLDPGDEEFLRNHARRIREAYKKIGGKPLVEDMRRRWSPYRILKPLETELDDEAVVRNLREAGLDPAAARKVALTGGLLPESVPQSTFRAMQGTAAGAKIPVDVIYNRTRTQLGLIAGVEEMGVKFAEMLPPGELGRTAKAALQGQMRSLQMGRKAAMNTLEDVLGGTMRGMNPSVFSVASPADITKGFMIDTRALKNMYPVTSERMAREVLSDVGKTTSFGQLQTIRDTLSTAVNNEMLPQIERDAAARTIKKLDHVVTKGLPRDVQPLYKNLNNATDDIFNQQYNTAFLRGLLKDTENATEFANYLVHDIKDPALFHKLEKALKFTDDGQAIIDSVRGHIGLAAVGGAVNPAGIINPKNLPRLIHSQEKGYGREFLAAVMGSKYMDHFDDYVNAMSKVDKAVDQAASTLTKGRVFGMGAVISGVSALTGHHYGGVWGGVASGLGFGSSAIIANALWQPEIVTKALASPKAAKLLVQTAERLSSGYSPKTTARLAARVFTTLGIDPMEYVRKMGLLPPTPEELKKAQMADAAKNTPGAAVLAAPTP